MKKLNEYKAKRDFSKTAEPQDGLERVENDTGSPIFVVQKHHARRLHFDLRLELDGVLKSWAVPKGPSLDPKVQRLAVEVEDHPLSYADFEGVIPSGQYGAGRVIVWDRGTWQCKSAPKAGLASGKLYFTLRGQRLRGNWRLVRTKSDGNQPQWLLSKLNDVEADSNSDVVTEHTTSILSGATLDQIGESVPPFIEPKLPSLVAASPEGDLWIHELKLDGYRMQARWSSDGFTLRTRSGVDWTERYPDIAGPLSQLQIPGTIMDGELTAIDAQGRTDFSSLQSATKSDSDSTLVFFVFDLLFLHGADLRRLPLIERKAKLQALLMSTAVADVSRLQFLDHIGRDPKPLVQNCLEMGLEGVVSKRIDRAYVSGRSQDWLKFKHRYRESFVVGGYETNSDDALSSLLLGYFYQDSLIFAGRVGTGWNDALAESLIARCTQYGSRTRPFSTRIAPSSAKRAKLKVHWVKPIIVINVEFAGWTESRRLRHASFASINDAKTADQITKETIFADANSVEETPEPQHTENHWPKLKIQLPEIAGLTSPERILFPGDGITKADVAAYLYQVNNWMLPHLTGRPVSFVRCPEGIDNEQYFQRHPQTGFPADIAAVQIADEDKPLIVISDIAGLLATAQLSAIELHPWGARADLIEKPDRMVIDLDPDEALPWHTISEAALIIRTELSDRGLVSFLKTTGGKGLHIVVPLSRRTSWKRMFDYAKSLADKMVHSHPNLFVATMSKSKRRNRVYIDYHRNRRGSTAVAAYSLRARPHAPVSTPLAWDELANVTPQQFSIRTVPQRLSQLAVDPWEGMGRLKQMLK